MTSVADVEPVIPCLRGSLTHRLAVEVYRRHHDAGTGVCLVCGYRTPCLVRRHAASVILAAGEDPRWYDDSRGGGSERADAQTRDAVREPDRMVHGDTPPYAGYRVTGRTRPLGEAGYRYERDT